LSIQILFCSTFFFNACWQIHLIRTNSNWILTSIILLFCNVFHFLIYYFKQSSDDTQIVIISFNLMFLMLYSINVALSYFIDQMKKQNFINSYILQNVLFISHNYIYSKHKISKKFLNSYLRESWYRNLQMYKNMT
jgi:hypothetical protein